MTQPTDEPEDDHVPLSTQWIIVQIVEWLDAVGRLGKKDEGDE